MGKLFKTPFLVGQKVDLFQLAAALIKFPSSLAAKDRQSQKLSHNSGSVAVQKTASGPPPPGSNATIAIFHVSAKNNGNGTNQC
jgi:hypothetical protein